MEQPEITLSVVTYHTEPAMFSACLESVASITLPFTCYVLDNSHDTAIERQVREWAGRFPAGGRMEYIANSNTGYGRTHNIAIKRALTHAGSRFHVVLNPDISFGKGVIETLAEWMQSHPDVGLVSPKIIYPNGRLQRLCKLLPTPGHLLARRFLPRLARQNDSLYQLECADYNIPFDCPSLSGCFMFLQLEALRQVGLFDERFFLYFEDVDLSRRIGQCCRTVYCPHAAVIHHYQKGSYSSLKLLLNHLVSGVKYFTKWGWFWDRQRDLINRQTIQRIKSQA